MKTKLTNSLIGFLFAAGLVITGTESIVMKTYAEEPLDPSQSETTDTSQDASYETSDGILSVYDTSDDTVTLAQVRTEADSPDGTLLLSMDDTTANLTGSLTAGSTITAADETAEEKQSEAVTVAEMEAERSAVHVIAMIAAAIAVLLLAGMLVTILNQ